MNGTVAGMGSSSTPSQCQGMQFNPIVERAAQKTLEIVNQG